MKKRGIINAKLMEELTKVRHQEKIVICDAGLPVPENRNLVDISLVAGFPTVEQVLKAVCGEMLLEEIAFPEVFVKLRPEFHSMIERRFINQKLTVIPNDEWSKKAYDPMVRLYIRTGDVLPCRNIILTSASGVPRHYNEFNVEFDSVVD